MIHYKREKMCEELVAEVSREALEDYWKETTAFPDMELKVRWEQYFWMEEQGAYHCYTARDDEEKMIGYVGYVVTTTLHYGDDVKIASSDILYIDPAYRRRGLGMQLLKAVEKDLKGSGVSMIQNHVSSRFDYSPMLLSMGYERTDIVYSRRLDDA